MKLLNTIVLFSVFALVLSGCGSNQLSVKKGDKLIVQEDLPRENAETQWQDSYTDGFTATIPKGTVLEVLFTPNAGGIAIECIPIEINGIKEAGAVEEFIVPERIRTKEGYKGYVFTIQKDYLGTKVIKSK